MSTGEEYMEARIDQLKKELANLEADKAALMDVNIKKQAELSKIMKEAQAHTASILEKANALDKKKAELEKEKAEAGVARVRAETAEAKLRSVQAQIENARFENAKVEARLSSMEKGLGEREMAVAKREEYVRSIFAGIKNLESK